MIQASTTHVGFAECNGFLHNGPAFTAPLRAVLVFQSSSSSKVPLARIYSNASGGTLYAGAHLGRRHGHSSRRHCHRHHIHSFGLCVLADEDLTMLRSTQMPRRPVLEFVLQRSADADRSLSARGSEDTYVLAGTARSAAATDQDIRHSIACVQEHRNSVRNAFWLLIRCSYYYTNVPSMP